MPQKPFLAFACAHLERLYAAQVAALHADYECTVFAFRDHDSLGAMAEELLAKTPARFTLIGLSLGGYLAFEIIRRQLQRLERLVLMDTTAAADHSTRRAGRLADIAKVREGGIEALIPELPARWLQPAHVQRVELTNLMSAMARSIGARGQFNQQTAMLSRPDSHADLERVCVPTLLACGREDRPKIRTDGAGSREICSWLFLGRRYNMILAPFYKPISLDLEFANATLAES